jgi:hypothetical protein
MTFSWVKAHAGIYGKELADRLAKESEGSNGTSAAFNRVPKSTHYYEAAEEAKQKWQDEWTTCAKAATTKQYFPTVLDRLRTKINVTPNLTAILTGHGRTGAYSTCSASNCETTQRACAVKATRQRAACCCSTLQTRTQRDVLKQHIIKKRNWPASKQELITK